VELEPRLIPVEVPDDPSGVVVVLHGGARRGDNVVVSPAQLSVLRMIPIARRIARAGRGQVAVYRLLNSRRGWETTHTPVEDARWALGELAGQLGSRLPCCLVGHSLGGRAALIAAGDSEVRSAVALAPWVLPSDMPQGMEGKPVLIIHGTRDRVASPERSEALARRLSATAGAEVDYVRVEGGSHAMLSHHEEFSEPAAEFAVSSLLDGNPWGAGTGTSPWDFRHNARARAGARNRNP
jgi:dienelactone hydrolase